jgi:predicted metalloprotease with PDZ domain
MKTRNKAIKIAFAAITILLVLILAGCSFCFGPFAVNMGRRFPRHFNFNEKQSGTENKSFGDNKNLENSENNQNFPFLGIEMSKNTTEIKGVLVSNVVAGSSAEKAGIKPQDIITAFDGKAVTSPAELFAVVQSHKVGDNVKVTVSRNNQSMELNVALGSFKDCMSNIEKSNQNNSQNTESENNKVY